MTSERRLWLVARLALFAALAWFYVAGVTEHARVVNTAKVRADQSSYLGDAVHVYLNRHGEHWIIGERNRMPVYAGYLSLFYDPRLSDVEFFEVAKIWNIRLSVVLLALFSVIFSWHLPPLVSTNLTLVIAFGYFIFKAGYAQSELLFYFLLFVTFLTCCYLLQRRQPARSLVLAALAGAFGALAHLTKAAALPFVAIFLTVYVASEVVRLVRRWRRGEHGDAAHAFAWRAAAGALMVACFLAVLYPYISTSKRVFGSYFYNVNTTFYVWYDTWGLASVGPYSHGDGVGWPTMPDQQLMSIRKYWNRHTIGEMADRVAVGFKDMVERSYVTFWYMKYVALYTAFAVALIAANRRAFASLIRDRAPLFAFMLLYAAIYLPAIAFYDPTAATWTNRLLLAHMAPLLFVLSCFFARAPFSDTRWTLAGVTVTPVHFHLLVLLTIGLDLTFTIWPRLMTTFGGT